MDRQSGISQSMAIGTDQKRRLVDLVGRASAANILGITVSALDKLVEIYELSEKLGDLREPGSSITWAREIKNLNKKLVTPTVLDTIVKKINERKITNSKDIRQLRKILRDPVAKEEFLSESGEIQSALEKVAPEENKKGQGLSEEVASLVDAIKRQPWTAVERLKGDPDLLRNIEEAEKVFEALKKQLMQK
jgi:ParB family chromosome partitioning protein